MKCSNIHRCMACNEKVVPWSTCNKAVHVAENRPMLQLSLHLYNSSISTSSEDLHRVHVGAQIWLSLISSVYVTSNTSLFLAELHCQHLGAELWEVCWWLLQQQSLWRTIAVPTLPLRQHHINLVRSKSAHRLYDTRNNHAPPSHGPPHPNPRHYLSLLQV